MIAQSVDHSVNRRAKIACRFTIIATSLQNNRLHLKPLPTKIELDR